MDLLRSATVTQGQVCGCPFDCFLICKHRSVTDERDATRTSRKGIGTIRTPTDELRMRYGRTTDTASVWTSWKNQACSRDLI